MARRLLLIRHSVPEVVPGVPGPEWRLSSGGRERAAAFADRLRDYNLRFIASSREPKASETAAIIAEQLGVPWGVEEGLHEHERSTVGWLGREEMDRRIAALLEHPDQPTFGDETGRQARERFGTAVARVLASNPEGDVAVVAHGTVITLFAQPADPFLFWRGLRMPDLAELEA